MEIFEYSIAEITGRRIGNNIQLIYKHTTYEKGENGSIKEKFEEVVLEDMLFEIVEDETQEWKPISRWNPDPDIRNKVRREQTSNEEYVVIDSSDLTHAIGPYLAKLGLDGWEVVEHKFNTTYPNIFTQALLKRKIQKD